MTFPFRSGVALVALTALAACGGGGTQSTGLAPSLPGASQNSANAGRPITTVSRTSPYHLVTTGGGHSDLVFLTGDDAGATPGGAYVGQFYATTVSEYAVPNTGNKAPRCTVPGAAVNGIGVNAKRVLYVPQVPSGGAQIASYAADCGKPGPVLTPTGGGQPTDVAFDGGIVYATNYTNHNIDVFAAGHTTPTKTLTNASITGSNFGIGVDNLHNVFESSVANNVVVEFVHGSGTGKVLKITGTTYPVGLEFDKSQNLVVTDASAGGFLIYKKPYTGAPTRVIHFKSGSVGYYGKLDAANANLYTGDATNGTVDVYNYVTGAYKYSFSNGLSSSNGVEGIALDPAAKN